MTKPTTTTAATTQFCVHKLEGPGGGYLWLDGNGKITAGNGTLADPKPNAFSLIQVADCPGATTVCKAGCYVHQLEKHQPDLHALYEHNSKMIRNLLLSGGSCQADLWAIHLGNWITANCTGGFRWHVSGDVFSRQYARWLAKVCAHSATIRHWIYTRTFWHDVVAILADVTNLSLNLSCDCDNYAAAKHFARLHQARLCYLTMDGNVPADLPEGSVIFPDYALRGGTPEGQAWFNALSPEYKAMVCPVDYHGKAENRRCGLCDRCLKPTGEQHVRRP